MSSKVYLFDKNIIKADFKRLWWIGVLFLICFFVVSLPGINIENFIKYGYSFYLYSNVESIMSFCFGILIGGLIFDYLHKNNSNLYFHSIPINRNKLYFSHLLSGFIIVVIPILICSIYIWIVEMTSYGEIICAYKFFYGSLECFALGFMITVFSAMIAGNIVASYVFAIGFCFLPFFVESIINSVLNDNLLGYDYRWRFTNKYIYFNEIKRLLDYSGLFYIVLAIVLIILCLFIYKARKNESCEDIVVFKGLKYAFMYTVAVCVGYVGYIFLSAENIFWGMMPLGIVALVGTYMLTKKSLSIKGAWKPVLIYVGCLLLLQGVFAFDLTGYERRIPTVDRVVSVEPYDNVISNYYDYRYITVDGKDHSPKPYAEFGYKGVVEDREKIEDIINLQKAIVEGERGKEKSKDKDINIQINYKLNNGKELHRSYWIDYDKYKDNLKGYFENDEYKMSRFPLYNKNKKEVTSINIRTNNSDGTFSSKVIDEINSNSFLDAYNKDVSSFDESIIEYINTGGHDNGYIKVYYVEYVENGGEILEYEICYDIVLNEYLTNTYAYINQYLK